MSERYATHSVRIEQVISGDDLMVLVELAFDDLWKKVRIRLEGVDTPDAYKESAATEAGKIRQQVSDIVRSGKCTIEVKSQSRKAWVVVLYVHKNNEKINLNELLKSQGFIYQRDRNHAKKKET